MLKHVIVALVLAVGVYFAGFHAIENRRHIKGPWQVMFTADRAGVPEIIITQPALNISEVKVFFPGEKLSPTNSPRLIIFDIPKAPPFDVPFGQVVFSDLTFLPGTVTFDLYGHEIEILPRTLTIDRKEYPWKPNATIGVSAADKIPPEKRQHKKR